MRKITKGYITHRLRATKLIKRRKMSFITVKVCLLCMWEIFYMFRSKETIFRQYIHQNC